MFSKTHGCFEISKLHEMTVVYHVNIYSTEFIFVFIDNMKCIYTSTDYIIAQYGELR